MMSTQPSRHPPSPFRLPTILKAVTILGLLITSLTYLAFHPLPHPLTTFIQPPLSETYASTQKQQAWTKIIWQTGKDPLTSLSGDDLARVKTWIDKNPTYRYEIMTDDRMETFVRAHFGTAEAERAFGVHGVHDVFFQIRDIILRADLVRYLLLLAEGGVYNDLDVGCEKPVDTWVPAEFADSAGVVLGVEVDNKFGPDGRTWEGGSDLFELVNWTMLAKADQPFIRFLVQRVVDNIRAVTAARGKVSVADVEFSIQDVLDVTGPAALTQAVFDYGEGVTGSAVDYRNFTKMVEPRMVGEVVVLPIRAFGAGHQVKWAGFEEDGSALVHHYFKGSWKGDHVDRPPVAGEGEGGEGEGGEGGEGEGGEGEGGGEGERGA